mmetsp:Transcript_9462/g.22344  ORF Transcript_9462/g.22344 Transcript_9462/m.22344 type:complete len:201 (-) Transcript_9462:1313-1915(-)
MISRACSTPCSEPSSSKRVRACFATSWALSSSPLQMWICAFRRKRLASSMLWLFFWAISKASCTGSSASQCRKDMIRVLATTCCECITRMSSSTAFASFSASSAASQAFMKLSGRSSPGLWSSCIWANPNKASASAQAMKASCRKQDASLKICFARLAQVADLVKSPLVMCRLDKWSRACPSPISSFWLAKMSRARIAIF